MALTLDCGLKEGPLGWTGGRGHAHTHSDEGAVWALLRCCRAASLATWALAWALTSSFPCR